MKLTIWHQDLLFSMQYIYNEIGNEQAKSPTIMQRNSSWKYVLGDYNLLEEYPNHVEPTFNSQQIPRMTTGFSHAIPFDIAVEQNR